MKNFKSYFSSLALGFLIFSFTCYSQTVKNEGEIKKCFIVSDIHFDPLFGAHNDTALYKKLERSSFDEWKKLFEGSKSQMTINIGLLGKDANYGVLQSALTNMKKRLLHPAFIVIAGDFIWHGAKPADSVLKKKSISFIAQLFKEDFPGVTIVPAMGNNDTYGQDYEMQDPRFLNDFANAWTPNLPKASADQLKSQGYYTCKAGNVELIVINSAALNYGSHYYLQGTGMLNWLQTNLADSNTKNVWIVMHIPPGLNVFNNSNFWNVDFTQTFVDNVVKYSPKINFIIASHTHLDDFRVFYNNSNTPVSFMRIVPSICSNHGNNPSFEIAEFNGISSKVEKETSYYLNLITVPQNVSASLLDWNATISLPSGLKLDKINALSFSKLIDDIKIDKTGLLLGDYVNFYTVGTSIDSSLIFKRRNYLNYLKADSLKGK
jgi:hypothetical protein